MASANGVFCIEADWFGLAHPMSMKPVLDLLAGSDARIPFVLRDAATRAEIEFYLRRWLQARYRRYDILWMAIHTRPGELLPGDMRKPEERLGIDALEGLLQGKCRGRILHFSGCRYFKMPPSRVARFLRTTRALCVSGFTREVPWLEATIFEAYWLTLLSYEARTRKGVREAARLMRREQGPLCARYGFVIRVAG